MNNTYIPGSWINESAFQIRTEPMSDLEFIRTFCDGYIYHFPLAIAVFLVIFAIIVLWIGYRDANSPKMRETMDIFVLITAITMIVQVIIFWHVLRGG